jgi:hypothetical protein
MHFLTELNTVAKNVESLEKFIESHLNKLFDFFNLTKDQELRDHKISVKELEVNYITIRNLDFTKEANTTFLNLLLQATIRLDLRLLFQKLFELATTQKITVSKTVNAASLYLIINDVKDVLNNTEKILDNLEQAYLEDEDSQDFPLTALFNFYSWLVQNAPFGPNAKEELRQMIWSSYESKKHQFIQHEIIQDLYQIDVSDSKKAYPALQKILDSFLGRDRTVQEFDADTFIIEESSDYTNLFSGNSFTFDNIQGFAAKEYKKIKDDRIFHSLGRGTAVLANNDQLLAYMFAYGKMHNTKLNEAFKSLPQLNEDLHIIDWACGQGLATISYLDYTQNTSSIQQVTLIEPSQIALKRAAFHTNLFLQDQSKIKTICKGFDNLREGDFNNEQAITLHLFSNVLDMNVFSLENLIQLIDSSFSGKNIFIISSPYINTTKTARIDAFVNSYKTKQEFNIFANINKRETSPSKVIRGFEVSL